MSFSLGCLAAYLLGGIPFSLLLVRLLKRVDLRTIGSGNVGATNASRAFGGRAKLAVFLLIYALDTAKGFVPAFLATVYVGHLAGVIAGGAAMLGHWRPLFLRFERGRKVVATCGGAFLGVAPLVGGIGAAVWILFFAVFRYASVASIAAALSLPLFAVGLGAVSYTHLTLPTILRV